MEVMGKWRTGRVSKVFLAGLIRGRKAGFQKTYKSIKINLAEYIIDEALNDIRSIYELFYIKNIVYGAR